ncbi:MAG TPA: thioredoxin family protein [Candidatus Babeliales bacterium]|nr:thioredoxin family protein [Candidatus Babeliales bacterium]
MNKKTEDAMETYNKKLIMLMSLLLINGISYAKVKSITLRRDFEQSISKENMVVTFFYDAANKDLMRMYEDISKTQRYDDADVVFLKVNAARKDLSDLAQAYGIVHMPAFVFFYKGKRLSDNNGNMVILTGSVTRDQLESCIDNYYGDEIERYIAHKEERKERRIARENESWKPYFYPRDIFVPGYDPAERNLE